MRIALEAAVVARAYGMPDESIERFITTMTNRLVELPVVIEVHSGVAYVEEAPEDIVVEIVDFDVEDLEEDNDAIDGETQRSGQV